MPFTKLDANFAGSSLLAQGGLELAGFWAVLLSKKDRAGEIHDSLPKLAHDCYTTKLRVVELLAVLEAKDPDSRTPDHDGRRVQVTREPRWCITILNHDRYREKDETAAERMRRYRAKKAGTVTRDAVTSRVSSASDSLSVSGSESVEGKKDPHPPEQRAELVTQKTIHSLQLRLGALLCQLSEHENSRLMVPDWCRKVTSYEREGRTVRGYADYRVITSIDRLEKSIGDAEFWLAELEKGRTVA